jgi:hypothetical protein
MPCQLTCAEIIESCSSTPQMTFSSLVSAVFVGIVGSLCVSLLVEWYRQPSLKIEIIPPEQIPLFTNFVVVAVFTALRVRVSNSKPPWFPLNLIQRQSARDCRATLIFSQNDTPVTRQMPGRWAGSVQPVPIEGVIKSSGETIQLYDIARLSAESRIHIPAGESEILDVAVRFTEETVAFGWTNESYRHNCRHPEYSLPIGVYLVEIIVQSEGVKKKIKFRLDNNYTINSFRLSPLGNSLPCQ